MRMIVRRSQQPFDAARGHSDGQLVPILFHSKARPEVRGSSCRRPHERHSSFCVGRGSRLSNPVLADRFSA
jgi:hypothetical protein